MKKLLQIFIVLVLFLMISHPTKAQNEYIIDSLKQVIESAEHDSIKIHAYKDWDDLIWVADPELDFELMKIIEEMAQKNLNKKTLNEQEKNRFGKDLAFAHNGLGLIYFSQSDYEKAAHYYNSCLEIYTDLNNKKGIARTYGNMGNLYYQKGDLTDALDYYNRSLQMSLETDFKSSIGAAYGNIGNVYADQGMYRKAIEVYTKSLKLYEEMEDERSTAYFQVSIGVLFKDIKDYESALKRYTESLMLFEKIEDDEGLAMVHNNIGNLYADLHETTKAVEHLNSSKAYYEKIGDKRGLGTVLSNIASIHDELEEFDKFMTLNQQSLAIFKEIGDKKGIAMALNNIGIALNKMGKSSEALPYIQESLELSKAMGIVIETRNASEALYDIFKVRNDYPNALNMFKLYISMRDSIAGEEAAKNIISQEFKYTYEKQKALDDKENEKKLAISAELEKKQKIVTYSVASGLALVLLFSFFIYNRLKITRKQKLVIEEQKEIVEEKNQEIMDSITYAKRIQSAILPPDKVVKEYLENSFILYKPKDIVAGDFYWMENINSNEGRVMGNEKEDTTPIPHNSNLILFAAADCTGHGVPGAMVSVVCNNALNRSVREHGLTDPGEILDMTRDIVIEEFQKSEEEVKDGMDIALCSLEYPSLKTHRSTSILKYAGAHNPLWIIRPSVIASEERTKQSSQSKDSPFEGNTRDVSENVGDDLSKYTSLKTQHATLYEVKADKQPIGQFRRSDPFTVHSFELQPGDSIYIFSDGYVDQFGGEKGKKFKAKAFRELLLSIQEQTMEQQRSSIDQAFETWRGNLEQIDDVCVIGVKV